jgi:2-keto-3-deoxy-L-fuconate dehydrogenase
LGPQLEGKTAVITAAGQGIGRAIAECFVAEGAKVWATDIDPGKLAGIDGATCRKLDVRAKEDIDALGHDAGPVDVLVNAAGYVAQGTILDCDDDDWHRSFQINVTSMHRMIRTFLPGMIARGHGSIVNIASCASSVRGIPDRYVYGATKGAVIALTKSVAIDFVRSGVRVNAVCPGAVDSPSFRERMAQIADRTGRTYEEVRKAMMDRQLNGRLGTAEEVAWLALFLASDRSVNTTGHIHFVDGGLGL